MFLYGMTEHRLRVVSNFGDSGEIHTRMRKWAPARRRVRAYFAGIAKIRDYPQSRLSITCRFKGAVSRYFSIISKS